MDYSEALNIIQKKQSLGIKPGLSRIETFLNSIDNPQDKIRIIHIAGTNGKGTVANTIASALMKNGYRVGLFTSPYIIDYREQIQINNEYIAKDRLADYVEKYHDNDLTEFELLTAIMYKYFCDENVDFAIVECGMGGRGDATNVEKRNIAVLCSISLDHTNFLGNTVEEITKEKEGIIKPDCPCFRYENTGDFNKDNLTLAKKVIKHLGLNDDIELVRPLARQQKIGNVLVDGGHNVEAGKALAPMLNNEIALIGMMADKNVDGYLDLVARKCKMIITTTPNNPRSMSSNELKTIAEKYCDNVVSVENPLDAIGYAKKNGLTLVCGSFYLIREIIKELL